MTLAQCHYDGEGTPQNKALAYDIWSRLEYKLPQADFKVAQMRYRGDGVPQSITLGYYGIAHADVRRDPEAIAWLAANGSPAVIDSAHYADANPDLDRANALLGGFGVSADPAAAAVKIIEARSAEGYPRANYLLGVVYERGLGLPKDLKRANSAYFVAADFGNGDACYRLGHAYWLGELGLSVDDAQDLRWLMTANNTGNADAL